MLQICYKPSEIHNLELLTTEDKNVYEIMQLFGVYRGAQSEANLKTIYFRLATFNEHSKLQSIAWWRTVAIIAHTSLNVESLFSLNRVDVPYTYWMTLCGFLSTLIYKCSLKTQFLLRLVRVTVRLHLEVCQPTERTNMLVHTGWKRRLAKGRPVRDRLIGHLTIQCSICDVNIM